MARNSLFWDVRDEVVAASHGARASINVGLATFGTPVTLVAPIVGQHAQHTSVSDVVVSREDTDGGGSEGYVDAGEIALVAQLVFAGEPVPEELQAAYDAFEEAVVEGGENPFAYRCTWCGESDDVDPSHFSKPGHEVWVS